ncbi:AraC family transcriptional regulator [Massilia litorea]|jgi:AraC-like DNA-binding protein|uniref:Helix-turn-helix transcriptional regulator n=1 Tax=Massilia litorea TaxID=2769491 RepID=A0A7L9U478_9BURK|nr:helix-turn-helix domain-containing protein [Massilia litorea]QOL49680.1 helix-turn-helix transcriptional regulator [Massilia litorea]
MAARPLTSPICPSPLERAPRAARAGGVPCESLRLAPASLQGALLALVARDTSALLLDDAQRLTHFPASPFVTISWFRDAEVGLVTPGPHGPAWAPFGASVVVSGTQAHPTVSWSPTTGRGHVACFTADAAQALFGLDLAAIQDRFAPVGEVIGPEFAALWDALLASEDAEVPGVLERHLARRWQAVQGRDSERPSLRQLGRHWVERLGWQASQWARVHSPRHVERRVKSFSGRSLREWQSIVRTEGLFFAARERYEAGLPFDWAGLAQDQGFTDQAHMIRSAKRITGFAPTEFAQRFAEDESFWMYRLWV